MFSHSHQSRCGEPRQGEAYNKTLVFYLYNKTEIWSEVQSHGINDFFQLKYQKLRKPTTTAVSVLILHLSYGSRRTRRKVWVWTEWEGCVSALLGKVDSLRVSHSPCCQRCQAESTAAHPEVCLPIEAAVSSEGSSHPKALLKLLSRGFIALMHCPPRLVCHSVNGPSE